MAKRRAMFVFPSELVREPIIYNLSYQFNLVTNIWHANISDEEGWVELELKGKEENIEQGIAWMTSRGVRVTPVTGDVGEE